jgi:hypothetical protein
MKAMGAAIQSGFLAFPISCSDADMSASRDST